MAKSVLDHVGEPCDAASATFLVIRGNFTYSLMASTVDAKVILASMEMILG